MLFDFNEAWSRVAASRYDVCVCGTGPAGITIARKLASYGKKVLLLEAGGLSYSDQSQEHYKGRNVGRTIWLESLRLRYLGGTSNHWEGLCSLIDPITFEAHDDHGLPGWPISREQVLANLEDAKEIVDIAGKDLEPRQQPGFPSPRFNRYGFALSAPTRFFEKYGAEIRQSQAIDAFYNANLVDVVLSDNLGAVKNIQVRNYNGQVTNVSAGQYVLALGGIENPRMLLNANSQIPAGIGNHSDLVGRCFMESLNVPIGRFLITDVDFWKEGSPPIGSILLVPTESMMRKHDIGNGVLEFTPNAPASAILFHGGRLGPLRKFIHETGCAWPSLTKLARQIVDFDCPGDGVIWSIIEQHPNRNSRITLSDDVDSFGLRRINMNWQLNDADLKTIRVLAMESAKEMARLDRARVQLAPFILDTRLEVPASGFGHHMGTTRMSADPRHGVVNENCRVHGIENLYLAGSSVFPKCGGKNPTLSIVLLALRLGEHLGTTDRGPVSDATSK
jgi:choline dehydrogenase-like flavoprotein